MSSLNDGDIVRNSIGLFGVVNKQISNSILKVRYHLHSFSILDISKDTSHFNVIQPKRIVLHDFSGFLIVESYNYNTGIYFSLNPNNHLGRKSISIEFPKENIVETLKSYWDEHWFIETELTESFHSLKKKWKVINEFTGHFIN